MSKATTDTRLVEGYLATICGRHPDDIVSRPVEGSDTGISVYTFESTPEDGYVTYFTWGVSRAALPAWVFSRPELLLCVNSSEPGWRDALCALVEESYGTCLFSYGEVFNIGWEIDPSSDVRHFFLFAPTIVDRVDSCLDVSDYRVCFTQLYPLNGRERVELRSQGAERFFRDVSCDLLDVYRT